MKEDAMISGDAPTLVEWRPLLDSPHTAHRLIVEGFELSNAIEWAQWRGDLAWLWACELCGDAECSGRGVARFRRLEDQLVWLRTREEDFSRNDLVSGSIETQGIISRGAWDRLRALGVRLPEFDSFGPLRREDLAGLWLAEMPERARVDDLTGLDRLLREELAANCPLEMEAAKERVRELSAWFVAAPADPIAGRIARLDPPEGLHIFFFDRAGYPEWPAFAASERWTLAFGGGFLYELPSPP